LTRAFLVGRDLGQSEYLAYLVWLRGTLNRVRRVCQVGRVSGQGPGHHGTEGAESHREPDRICQGGECVGARASLSGVLKWPSATWYPRLKARYRQSWFTRQTHRRGIAWGPTVSPWRRSKPRQSEVSRQTPALFAGDVRQSGPAPRAIECTGGGL